MRKLKRTAAENIGIIETLDYFEKNFFSEKKLKKLKSKKIEEEINFKIPEFFSLIDNVDITMNFIKSLFVYRYNMDVNIKLDLSECKTISMCALFLFDYIMLMIFYERGVLIRSGHKKSKMNYMNYKFSENNEINKIFLDAGTSGYIPNDTQEFLEIRKNLSHIPLKLFKVRAGDRGKNTNQLVRYLQKESKIEHISTLDQNVQTFINECLGEFGYYLNIDGERVLQKIISEWKTNCNNHLKNFCEFFCTGSLTYKNNLGVCDLVLVNFGDTINDSIKAIGTTEIGIRTFDRITNKQNYNSKFTKENGIVLAAIQKKVSRLKTDSNVRGTGFPQIMEFFSKLSDDEENSKMTIISGNTQIRFAKNEYLRYNNNNGEIYFNDEKIPSIAPNINNVKKIESKFPGTLISIRFILKKEHITSNKKEV